MRYITLLQTIKCRIFAFGIPPMRFRAAPWLAFIAMLRFTADAIIAIVAAAAC